MEDSRPGAARNCTGCDSLDQAGTATARAELGDVDADAADDKDAGARDEIHSCCGPQIR